MVSRLAPAANRHSPLRFVCTCQQYQQQDRGHPKEGAATRDIRGQVFPVPGCPDFPLADVVCQRLSAFRDESGQGIHLLIDFLLRESVAYRDG